jgi:serine/threonine-protein kinase Chk1
VKLAINHVTGEQIAIKIIRTAGFNVQNQFTESQLGETQNNGVTNTFELHREIAIHKALNHHNILRLFDHVDERQFQYLLLELAAGGELFDKIGMLKLPILHF